MVGHSQLVQHHSFSNTVRIGQCDIVSLVANFDVWLAIPI